jgi:sensor histidine kinase YesM
MVIATTMGLIGMPGTFAGHVVISLSIGLMTLFLISFSQWVLSDREIYQQLSGMLLMILIGSYLGMHIGLRINGAVFSSVQEINQIALTSLPFGLLFGGMISWFFYSRGKLDEARALVSDKELARTTREKELIQTQLKLLQAQIEPHFLFNTLANVHSMILINPERAILTLEKLNLYLRATLNHSRSEQSYFSNEIDLLTAYLEIQKIRMGERLTYCFHVPSEIAALPFPPMLLQPLVENAIKHGIEPSLDGGTIHLHAAFKDQSLLIEIADDGVGLGEGYVFGFGLSNVRDRLFSLFGVQAKFKIVSFGNRGVKILLDIPKSRLTGEGNIA